MLLLRHFFQSLRGIGAMDAFRNGKERRVKVRRFRYVPRWQGDPTREGWRFTPLWGANTSNGDRVLSVEVEIDRGGIAVTVMHQTWVPAYLKSTFPDVWAGGYRSSDTVRATFANPIRAAVYVAAWLGFTQEPSCECHQSDCALAA